MAVLPPLPATDEAPPAPSGMQQAWPDAVVRAQAMEIPWERILLEEIRAEQALRRYVDDPASCPLDACLTVLSFSFLQSWRVRDRVRSLSCEARSTVAPAAVRQLRAVFRRLAGKTPREQAAFAEHLWFAYQRVLLLHRAVRAARKSRGTTAERVAFVCTRARCTFDDAAWAVCEEASRRQGHRLDAAVRRVREEGFQIPRAQSEARAFGELRSMVRASRHLAGRQPRARRAAAPHSVPPRLALPADAL